MLRPSWECTDRPRKHPNTTVRVLFPPRYTRRTLNNSNSMDTRSVPFYGYSFYPYTQTSSLNRSDFRTSTSSKSTIPSLPYSFLIRFEDEGTKANSSSSNLLLLLRLVKNSWLMYRPLYAPWSTTYETEVNNLRSVVGILRDWSQKG